MSKSDRLLARSFHAKTLVLENIPPCGIIAEENEDILQLYPTYSDTGLIRLTFWKRPVATVDAILLLSNDDLVGYAVVKRDTPNGEGSSRWHVFEAVFPKYDHTHNCVPPSADLSPNRGAVRSLLSSQDKRVLGELVRHGCA